MQNQETGQSGDGVRVFSFSPCKFVIEIKDTWTYRQTKFEKLLLVLKCYFFCVPRPKQESKMPKRIPKILSNTSPRLSNLIEENVPHSHK